MHEDKKLVLRRRLGTPRNHFIAHIVMIIFESFT